MGILAWIIFGAIAGWIASMIAGTNHRQGCITNIVVGVFGAFLGGVIMQFFTGREVHFGFTLESFAVAILGAVILLAIVGWARRANR